MFVWCSKGTEESAAKIAEKLGCDHGTVPPKGYEGDVYCLGAVPAANFKWGDRKFGKIYNDPRKLRAMKTPEELKKLGVEISTPVRIFCSGEKVLKVVNKETGVAISGGVTNNAVFQNVLKKLDNPSLVAIEAMATTTGGVITIRDITNVILGPALTEHDDVVSSICADVGNEAKKELDDIAKAASPEEARAILAVLRKLGKG